MKRSRHIIIIILALMLFANNALAQTEKNVQSQQSSTPAVTASVSAGNIRFASPEGVLQMRLEIYSASGELMFDSSLRKGSILDWKITDATQAMTDGSYVSVVTVMDFQGQLRQRLGALTVQSGQLTLKRLAQGELNAAQSKTLTLRRQSQKIELTDNDDALTIMRDGKDRAVVVAAHDGQDGQVTSTSGALSFRTGNVFSGAEKEQMRVTPEGRVGIGTNKPEATLDVAGTIRAREGIVFADGTVLKSASEASKVNSGGVTVSAPTVNPTANVAGTGTTSRLTKWTDGVGTLGDSAITEVGGNVGIGTASPASTLHLAGPGGVNAITLNTPGNQRFRFQTVPNIPNWGAFTINSNYNSGWFLDEPGTNGWFFKLDTRGGNNANTENGLWLYRIPSGPNPHTNETPVFGVTTGRAFFADNVGIGVNAPAEKLRSRAT